MNTIFRLPLILHFISFHPSIHTSSNQSLLTTKCEGNLNYVRTVEISSISLHSNSIRLVHHLHIYLTVRKLNYVQVATTYTAPPHLCWLFL